MHVKVFLVCDAVAVMDVEVYHTVRSGHRMLTLRLDFASACVCHVCSSECSMKRVTLV